MHRYKPYLRLLFISLCCAIGLIFAYSPGFLALRPTNPSILKAGLSILIIPFAFGILGYETYQLLRPKKEPNLANTSGEALFAAAVAAIEKCQQEHPSQLSKTLMSQVKRLIALYEDVEATISSRFIQKTQTYIRYMAIVDESTTQMLKTVIAACRQLMFYNEKEYQKLKATYKQDAIPDQIQEEQLEFMESVKDKITDNIAVNERMLIELKRLGLSVANSDMDAKFLEQNNEITIGIQNLISELKYYQ